MGFLISFVDGHPMEAWKLCGVVQTDIFWMIMVVKANLEEELKRLCFCYSHLYQTFVFLFFARHFEYRVKRQFQLTMNHLAVSKCETPS